MKRLIFLLLVAFLSCTKKSSVPVFSEREKLLINTTWHLQKELDTEIFHISASFDTTIKVYTGYAPDINLHFGTKKFGYDFFTVQDTSLAAIINFLSPDDLIKNTFVQTWGWKLNNTGNYILWLNTAGSDSSLIVTLDSTHLVLEFTNGWDYSHWYWFYTN